MLKIQPYNQARFKACTGHTILELVIVIIVMAAIIAGATYFMPSGDPIDLKAQAEKLADDIRYTQALAIAREASYRIYLNETNQYHIADSADAPIIHPGLNSSTINLGNGMILSAPYTYISFDKLGAPYEGPAETLLTNDTTLTLSKGSLNKTVVISGETGKVTLP